MVEFLLGGIIVNYPQSSPQTPSAAFLKFMQDQPSSSDIRIVHGYVIGGKTSSKGRLKRLYLQRNEDEMEIKLPKPLGYTLAGKVQPGMMLQVWVRPDNDDLKALMVMPGDAECAVHTATVESETVPSPNDGAIKKGSSHPSAPVCRIKVCTKGKCYKRGGRQVMQALEAAIAHDESLGNTVTLEPTGCLKNCKHGPTVKVSPGSKMYSHVQPDDTHRILHNHAGAGCEGVRM